MTSEARPGNLVQFTLQSKQTYFLVGPCVATLIFIATIKRAWNLPRECNIFDSLLDCTERPPRSQVTTTGCVVKTFSTKSLQKYKSLWEGKTENSIFSHANLSHILPACIKSI